ncbi:MAG: hypothetical protein U1F10_02455 [Burkholderiales bacterium]
MNDFTDIEAKGSDALGTEASARRRFLKRAGGSAVAAPAVVLLLSAQSKSAYATGYAGGGRTGSGISGSRPDLPLPTGKNLLDPP